MQNSAYGGVGSQSLQTGENEASTVRGDVVLSGRAIGHAEASGRESSPFGLSSLTRSMTTLVWHHRALLHSSPFGKPQAVTAQHLLCIGTCRSPDQQAARQFRPSAIMLHPSAFPIPVLLSGIPNPVPSLDGQPARGSRASCDLSGWAAEVTATGPGSNGRHRAGIGPANGWSLTCRISASHKTTHSILPGP